jgi:hypothetical protein
MMEAEYFGDSLLVGDLMGRLPARTALSGWLRGDHPLIPSSERRGNATRIDGSNPSSLHKGRGRACPVRRLDGRMGYDKGRGRLVPTIFVGRVGYE